MTPRWNEGRAIVDDLLSSGRLTRVAPNRELADDYLRQARQHISSAETLVDSDPEGAFQLAYDAARKSLAAVLVNQGLRASGAGAHMTVHEAVRAQLGSARTAVMDEFGWMRRLRNTTEYPATGEKPADEHDVREAIPAAEQFIDTAEAVLDLMTAY
ncbi:hypothetical protein BH10ACT7_BH10ACT7_17680 [soil metagenome]